MLPFLRIGFLNFQLDPGLAYHEEVLDPYCAVYLEDSMDTGRSSGGAVAHYTVPPAHGSGAVTFLAGASACHEKAMCRIVGVSQLNQNFFCKILIIHQFVSYWVPSQIKAFAK